jgi:hypothetical protein
MSENPSMVDLANLDRLYWHTDQPVATIAGRVGLPARSLQQHVTPIPAWSRSTRCATWPAPRPNGCRCCST